MSADFSKGNSVENVPPERFQNQSITNGTQGGAVLFAPPSKSCRFSHPPSPCAKSMAQGISLSADSDLEGTCPLRTPRQLRSAGAALLGNLMRYVLFLHVYALFSAQPQSFSAQQKSSATSRISSARGGASLFSLSCPAQAQRSGLTSSCVRSSVWLRLQLQTLPVRWEPEQLQTHPWFSACC